MPNPKKYKDKQKWMADCMHQNKTVEGKPQEQSVAICLNIWRNKDKKKRKKSAGDILRGLAAALDPVQEISKDPGNKGAPHYYIVNKTYEVVTPESAEEGDAAERGFDYEGKKYDSLKDLVTDWANRENWVEWSSSHVSGEHEWLTSEGEQDPRTGGYTSHGLHIKRSDDKPLSKREVDTISKSFGVKRYTYVGPRQE